ncbi:SET domain-containing protein [Nadsonia fulvescens var. elongata DSM 6958]|uniref:SET domain-containing protein n=1 Tax=Nadsonia fulvescens var. elongata DSM 6958 TaxID=857566 RepID=A0A1E3PNW3_9ASCO|nr:SET domain-containing protein [Nadsonia fulvescens var. elongata DSM 6958]
MVIGLEKWISDGGGMVSSKIKVKKFLGKGHGVVAIEDIKPGERLILVRNAQLINMRNVYPYFLNFFSGDSTQLSDGISILNTISAQGIMALFLLMEQTSKSKSPWANFLSVLPTPEDLQTTPLTWERCETQEPSNSSQANFKARKNNSNGGSNSDGDSNSDSDSEVEATILHDAQWRLLSYSTRQYVLKQEKNVTGDFKGCESLIKLLNSLAPTTTDLSMITSAQYKHAWLCVNSRCLYHTLSAASSLKTRAFNWKASDNLTMAPYVDFLNHSTDTKLHCVAKTVTLGFEVCASPVSGYKKGEEILLCYGAHSNEKLLCEYGFCVDDNPWETVDITNEIVSGYIMNKSETDFSKEINVLLNKYDYYDGYTINNHGLSFRTEVAIMAYLLYSKRNAIATRDPERSLNAFMNGLATLSDLKVHMKQILREILVNVEQEIKDLISNNSLRDSNVVKRLAVGKLTVVRNVLIQLNEDQ